MEVNCSRDQKILVSKNTIIYQIKRENEKLQKIVSHLKSEISQNNSNLSSLNESNVSNIEGRKKQPDEQESDFIDINDVGYEFDVTNMDLPP